MKENVSESKRLIVGEAADLDIVNPADPPILKDPEDPVIQKNQVDPEDLEDQIVQADPVDLTAIQDRKNRIQEKKA